MSALESLGIGRSARLRRPEGGVEFVMVRRQLDRILAFTGFSIDDVVNNPIAKNAVLGYYKVHKQVRRRCDVVDLERQWNGVTRAG